jgi:hypothetical protein
VRDNALADFLGVARVRRTHPFFSASSSVLQTSVISFATGALVQVFNLSLCCLQQIFKFHNLISVWESAGASVIACQRSNRHLIALEPDSKIFEALLKPYVDAIPQPEERADSITDSDSEEDIAPKKKKGCKYCGASYLHVSSLSNIKVFIEFVMLTLFNSLVTQVSHDV